MREHVRDGWENHFKAIDLPSIPTLFTLSLFILTVEKIQEDFVFYSQSMARADKTATMRGIGGVARDKPSAIRCETRVFDLVASLNLKEILLRHSLDAVLTIVRRH